jgi:hypothetical protein
MSVLLLQKFALDGATVLSRLKHGHETRQMNEMPIQCDGFAIKSCSHGLRELLGAPSVEGTRIEALQRHFVLNDSIITARDTGTIFLSESNADGNMAPTACTRIQCKLCIK